MHSGEAARSLTFEASDAEAAQLAGARLLAQALGRPDEFASLDGTTGRFQVGAALWSRTGFFRLSEASETGRDADALVAGSPS